MELSAPARYTECIDYEILRLSVHIFVISWHYPFLADGIDVGYAVDFLDAKVEATTRIQQQSKPHLDGITLGYAEYNTWNISKHHKVCSCGFARGNISSGLL